MLNVARKYGVELEVINPSREIKESLPLWHHIGENPEKRQLNNKPQCKCLRGNHNVHSVGDGMKLLHRLQDPAHRPDKLCVCDDCYDDKRIRGCKDPHSCAMTVVMRLDQIIPDWDP
ncbi:hypothetical protein C8R43DRAFT_832235, partial [Mycena crocata]